MLKHSNRFYSFSFLWTNQPFKMHLREWWDFLSERAGEAFRYTLRNESIWSVWIIPMTYGEHFIPSIFLNSFLHHPNKKTHLHHCQSAGKTLVGASGLFNGSGNTDFTACQKRGAYFSQKSWLWYKLKFIRQRVSTSGAESSTAQQWLINLH